MIRRNAWISALVVLAAGVARGEEPARDSSKPAPKPAAPGINLLDAMRADAVTAVAEGMGNGQMAITVTNNTNRKLRVVLPPGLVATGATGQMGGMGGMGGGMGGMGGGMGGMGGGMGGGGMGGRGGMGGGMGGGSRMLTLPPTMGLMMLGRLIMTLVEPTESWNPRTLMVGMSGMGGMGGMGGGMGGMGMGGMGGGGFRSVPPTALPDATLQPGQTRRLATRLVSLDGPAADGSVAFPAEGEKLLIGDIDQINSDARVQKALRRLAADKAPETVAQLVLWNVAARLDWSLVAQAASNWANPQELDLAREFVSRLDSLTDGEAGKILVEVTAQEDAHKTLASDLTRILKSSALLGLGVSEGVPETPTGPAVGCKVRIVGDAAQPEALVFVAATNGRRQWNSLGKFSLPVATDEAGKRDLTKFTDALAEGLMNHLVRARLIRGRKLEGVVTYRIEVTNLSPLILNGVAVAGTLSKPSEPPRFLLGVALPPQAGATLSVSPGAVENYGMKKGLRLVGLDLSAL
jgi:hypothetical protein